MGGTALDPRRVTQIKDRGYIHFDSPLGEEERSAFTVSPLEVAQRSFWPFLGFDRVERQIDFEHEPYWKIANKKRSIRYSSHRDSAIFSYYSQELNARYEEVLAQLNLGDSVLAYRSGIGSNIKFAKSLFDEIKNRDECFVICLDVSKFFDSLDHTILEKRIIKVLGVSRLPKDWIKVFKRLTRFEYVDTKSLANVIRRSGEHGKVCSLWQFQTKVRPIIEINRNAFGIPQGSPLSGALANVYLLPFDAALAQYLKALGGSYRRYSDDLAIVLPKSVNADAVIMAVNVMLDASFLRINPKKTTQSTFCRDAAGPLRSSGDMLQYLGFTFDGERILIRSASLKRFYARMKRSIRIAVRAARKAGHGKDDIRRRSLVGRYTHWGDQRNFVQYAYRASRELESQYIRRQLRNHVKIFDGHFAKMKTQYYS